MKNLSNEEKAQKALGTLQEWEVIIDVTVCTHAPPAGLFQSWKEYDIHDIHTYVEALDKKSAQKKAEAYLETTSWMKKREARMETRSIIKTYGERINKEYYDLCTVTKKLHKQH